MSVKPGSAVTLLILLMVVSSAQTLSCGPSEFKTNNRCRPLCPPGSYVYKICTDSTRTSCSPCPEGTFMNHLTPHNLCYDCSTCGTGPGLRMKTPCMKTSDTVCEPVEGFYCRESAGGNCWRAEKHSSCRPGEYIRDRGTSTSDTLCSLCSAGTFSDGTSCRPHRRCEEETRVLLRPGTGSEDAQCGGGQSDWIVALVVSAVSGVASGAVGFVVGGFLSGSVCLRTVAVVGVVGGSVSGAVCRRTVAVVGGVGVGVVGGIVVAVGGVYVVGAVVCFGCVVCVVDGSLRGPVGVSVCRRTVSFVGAIVGAFDGGVVGGVVGSIVVVAVGGAVGVGVGVAVGGVVAYVVVFVVVGGGGVIVGVVCVVGGVGYVAGYAVSGVLWIVDQVKCNSPKTKRQKGPDPETL